MSRASDKLSERASILSRGGPGRHAAAVALGRRGGKRGGRVSSPAKTKAARRNAAKGRGVSSPAKAAAARANGQLGGRPRRAGQLTLF